MIAIEGTEILNIRHLGSHFNDYMGEVEPGYEGDKVDYILSQIADREGIAQFFHPGRYTDDDPSEYTPQRGVLV